MRAARQIAGLNQEELGKRLGLTRAKLGEYENARSSVPVSVLYRLSKTLKIELSFFFDTGNLSPELEKLAEIDPMLTHEAIALLRDFNLIDNPVLKKEFAGVLKRAAELIREKAESKATGR